jgi:hypothetical protein
MKRSHVAFVAAGAALLLLVGGMQPAFADETNPEPPAAGPQPGDPTSTVVPFSSPIAFTDAVAAAASYPGTVLAIHYDNPEVSGEYSFDSGQTPAEFQSQFNDEFATTPAATSLLVASTVPTGSQPSARLMATPQGIATNKAAFVPKPATFSPAIQKLTQRPTAIRPAAESVVARTAAVTAAVTAANSWIPDQASVYVTNYAGTVDISSSYWWFTAGSTPANTPAHWGVEYEVNMLDPKGDFGSRPDCHNQYGYDGYYKSRLAAQNQHWNWKAIRPDGQWAPSNLGAYADYNDWLDDCNRASFAIGLRYPQNIEYVNGAYGIVFSISAPKGMQATSIISGGTQAVYDGFCNYWPYSVGAKTDCMGVTAGSWPLSGPHASGTLNVNRGWRGPKLCWFSDNKGQTAPVNTSNEC